MARRLDRPGFPRELLGVARHRVENLFQSECRGTEEGGELMVGAVIAALVIIAIVLVLLKVAVAGGILGLIAIVLLILLLMGRV
jgi:hypothetical protein